MVLATNSFRKLRFVTKLHMAEITQDCSDLIGLDYIAAWRKMLGFPLEKHCIEEREQNIVRATRRAHPCVSQVDFPVYTTKYPLTVGELYSSSTDNSANVTEEDTVLAVETERLMTLQTAATLQSRHISGRMKLNLR